MTHIREPMHLSMSSASTLQWVIACRHGAKSTGTLTEWEHLRRHGPRPVSLAQRGSLASGVGWCLRKIAWGKIILFRPWGLEVKHLSVSVL